MTLRGFYFSKITPNWPKKCEDVDEFSLKLLILLSKKNNVDNGWQDFIKTCSDKLSPSFKFQINYHRTNNNNLKALKHILTKEELSKVKTIYKTGEKVRKGKKWDTSFISAMKTGFDKKHKILIFRQNKKILKAIEKERKSFLSGILKIIVAMRVDNQAWAKKVIREFINMGPGEMIFYHQLGENQESKNIERYFKQFLDQVSGFLDDVKWKEMFFNQLAILTSSPESVMDLGQWNVKWSFQEIQDQYKSQNYGIPYLGFWYEMYNYHTFPAQVERFMRGQLTSENIKKWGQNYAWLFAYYFPEEKKAQQETLKIIDGLVASKNMYHKYLVLELLENLNNHNNFKALYMVEKRFPSLSRPLFQLKRKFYKDLLAKGEIIEFSIYQLLKLKDIVMEKEILWWVTF